MIRGHRSGAVLVQLRPGVVALAALLLGLAHPAIGQGSERDAEIPAPQGFVTDTAQVVDPPSAAGIATIAEELRQRTGTEIAILTVPTTGDESTFDYAMRVAENWRVGSKERDEGVLIVVAVDDRRLHILTGYGVEGALPDGWVGELRDTVLGPAFRAGRYGPGLLAATQAIALRIAADRGVELSGLPPATAAPSRGRRGGPADLLLLLLLILFSVLSPLGQRLGGRRGVQRQSPGAWGSSGLGSAFGSGRGGFGGFGGGSGGFGGGSFGGGGAGGSW